MKPEIDLSEVLRRKFKDVDTAFCELQASSSSTAHFHCLTTETVPVFPRYTLPPLRTLQHQPGASSLRERLHGIKEYVPSIVLGDAKKCRDLFRAFLEGLWHAQNPHLGRGHQLGVADASLAIKLIQNAEFRLYVAGLVHNAPDRISAAAMSENLGPLLEGTGTPHDVDTVRRTIFRAFDSSSPVDRDGTLFIDDFARFFRHGSDAADRALQRVPLGGAGGEESARCVYNRRKLRQHTERAEERLEARAREHARARRTERLTQTLMGRLEEEIGYLSAAGDRRGRPGHGGDRERVDVEFLVDVLIQQKEHRSVPDAAELGVRLHARSDPTVSPALALMALDARSTGLLTPEQVCLALEQCGVRLTWTELHLLALRYAEKTPRGVRFRWVRCMQDLGGVPPSILKDAHSRGTGAEGTEHLMDCLRSELLYWEAAVRTAVEAVEQRFTQPEELASQLVFSPVGVRRVREPSVRLFWTLDDETATNNPHVHAKIIDQPPVHVFLTTVPTPAQPRVKVSLLPSTEKPPPRQDGLPHPIFDSQLVQRLSHGCLARWKRLWSVATTYAAGNASGDPTLLTKADLKYVLYSSLKGEKLTETQIATLMEAFPGPRVDDAAACVVTGSERLVCRDLMLGLLPCMADLAAEKERLGTSMMERISDERDHFAVVSQLSYTVFKDYAILRGSLEGQNHGICGMPTDAMKRAIRESLNLDVTEHEINWAVRFVHGDLDLSVNGRSLMNLVAVSMVHLMEEMLGV